MEGAKYPQGFAEYLRNFVREKGIAKIISINHDLSLRRYYRIFYDDARTAILMDSSLEKEQFKKFVTATNFFHKLDFTVPEIYELDNEHSLAIIEDFGDNIYNEYLVENPQEEQYVYKEAINVIIELHKAEYKQQFPHHGYDELMAGIKKYTDNCCDEVRGREVKEFFAEKLDNLKDNNFYCLRDYHADNLIWLPERKGYKRVGLLDYQDLCQGFRSYDLLSLLQDARRYISKEIEEAMLDYYIRIIDVPDAEAFKEEYHLLSLQRNLRIYGLFTEAAKKRGLTKYLDYLPTVKKYLERGLPCLSSLIP